jgi:homospermidine synthase
VKVKRLGLVRRAEMINALVWAVENPAEGVRVMDVEKIRSFRTPERLTP